MKKIVIMTVILGFILTLNAQITEFPITPADSDQKNPSIYGNTIVWEERGWKVFGATPDSWTIYPYMHIFYCIKGDDNRLGPGEDIKKYIPIGSNSQHKSVIY